MAESFSASVAGRLIACHASAHLELAIPNWTPPDVDPTAGQKGVGTARHKMLEPLMELSANDLRLMVKYLDYVAQLRSTRRFKVLVEQSVTAEWLATKPRTTADLVLYTQDELHIIDGKWGKIPVEVVGNEQLLFYAATYGPLAPKAKGATLHILQPYADNYSSWFADTNVIAQFMATAQAAERSIQAGDTSFGPSDHCTFCPANPHARTDKGSPLCPEMMRLLYPDRGVDEDEILSLA